MRKGLTLDGVAVRVQIQSEHPWEWARLWKIEGFSCGCNDSLFLMGLFVCFYTNQQGQCQQCECYFHCLTIIDQMDLIYLSTTFTISSCPVDPPLTSARIVRQSQLVRPWSWTWRCAKKGRFTCSLCIGKRKLLVLLEYRNQNLHWLWMATLLVLLCFPLRMLWLLSQHALPPSCYYRSCMTQFICIQPWIPPARFP